MKRRYEGYQILWMYQKGLISKYREIEVYNDITASPIITGTISVLEAGSYFTGGNYYYKLVPQVVENVYTLQGLIELKNIPDNIIFKSLNDDYIEGPFDKIVIKLLKTYKTQNAFIQMLDGEWVVKEIDDCAPFAIGDKVKNSGNKDEGIIINYSNTAKMYKALFSEGIWSITEDYSVMIETVAE